MAVQCKKNKEQEWNFTIHKLHQNETQTLSFSVVEMSGHIHGGPDE